jgi:hypothetical protein
MAEQYYQIPKNQVDKRKKYSFPAADRFGICLRYSCKTIVGFFFMVCPFFLCIEFCHGHRRYPPLFLLHEGRVKSTKSDNGIKSYNFMPTLNKNPPRRRNQRLRAGHREPCCFAIKTIGGSPVNGFVFISIRKADQTRAKT